MDAGLFSYIDPVIQAIDPGHAILEMVRPALNIFRSETFAPDISLAMVLSAVVLALYFRFLRVGPACAALQVRIRFLKKCTSNHIFSDNFYEFDLLMKEERFLEHGWNEFVETCLLRDPRLKADIEITVRPSDFMNINDAENSGLNIKWFHGLSPVYVGVGLLFTFAGLVAALYFSAAAINAVINASAGAGGSGHEAEVQRALAQLLNTATFKFLTSIAGLGCSIALAFVDRRWRAAIEHDFDELCQQLERCTVMVTPESIADRQYQKLCELTDTLKRLSVAPRAEAESLPVAVPAFAQATAPETPAMPAVPAVPLQDLIQDAVGRIEAATEASTRILADSFAQALARHRDGEARPEEPATVSAVPSQTVESALAAALERIDRVAERVEAAVFAGSRSVAATLEHALAARAEPAPAPAPLPSLAPLPAPSATLPVEDAVVAALERTLCPAVERLTAAMAKVPALLAKPEPDWGSRIDSAAGRVEAAVAAGSRAVVTTLERTLATALMPAPTLTPISTPAPTPIPVSVAPPPAADPAQQDWPEQIDSATGRIEAAVTAGSQAIVTTLEQTLTRTLTQIVVPAATPAPGPAPVDLKNIVTEMQGIGTSLVRRLEDLAAAIRADGNRTAEMIREGFAQLVAHKETAGIDLASAATAAAQQLEQRGSAVAGLALDSTEQVLAKLGAAIERLSWPVERLTGSLDQVEGKFAAHLAAFDALSRAARETEQAMTASGLALQSASQPLTRVSAEMSGAMAAMTGGVEATVRALAESRQAGEKLAGDLSATCDQLQGVWRQHEGRFAAVDESVARILAAIIQHAEAHGEAIRGHVVAIDTHLSHAVSSLAANIEALQEMVADLTEATSGTERLAALIIEKSSERQG